MRAFSKGRKARTVAEVIAAEAGGKTKAERKREMEHIASVIANRAQQLGISPEAVVASGDFDAYGKTMPPGTQAYQPMAKTAFSKIQTDGPVTSATYYATPEATKNLPSAKSKVAQTFSHVFYDGPLKAKVDVAETPEQIDKLSRQQLPGGILGPKAASALADTAFSSRFAAQPPGLLGKPGSYSVGGVDVAESPEAIDQMSQAQMAPDQSEFDARFAGVTPSNPPSAFGNTAQATPDQRMGDTFDMPGLNTLDRSQIAQAAARFDPAAVKASGLARTGPPDAPQVAGIGAAPAGIGAAPPGMMTDDQGTFADTFGNMKPGGILAKADAPKFQQSLAEEQAPTAPANISPAPQPEQTAMAAPAQAPEPDVNAAWEANHPVNTAFDDQYEAAAAPDLAAPTDVPDYNVADVPETGIAPDEAQPDEQTIDSYPDAPEQSWAEANPKTSKALKDAATGGLLGGPMGAAIGAAGGLLAGRLGPGFDAAVPGADRYSVGSGLQGIRGALGGPYGATANSLSNPGMSVTSLGTGQSLRRSDKFGWTEVVGPDGSVVGIHYDNPDKKGLLGKMSNKMGGLLGGRRASDISPAASHAIGLGKGGLY